MTKAVYEQATGLLCLDTLLPQRFIGYAGRSFGRNNPDAEFEKNLGPLPSGRYAVSVPFHHPRKGPLVFRLHPATDNVMKGRSGFLIHGDNTQGDASHGCIILDRRSRQKLADANLTSLTVVSILNCATQKAAKPQT